MFDLFKLGIFGLFNNIRAFELRKHHESGTQDSWSGKIVNVQCHKIFFDNQLCHLFTIRDVTKQTLYSNVRKDNQNLKIFAASVSHEMLNPLKCIITFAD